MSTTTHQPNRRLAALLQESGMTSKGLARRMTELSNTDGGEAIAPSHTNVDRWLSGATSRPKPRTCQIMATVISQALGRSVSVDDLGYGDAESGQTQPAREVNGSTPEATTGERGGDSREEPPLVEQWVGDTDRPIHNRVSGNVGNVIQIGGDHHGGITLS